MCASKTFTTHLLKFPLRMIWVWQIAVADFTTACMFRSYRSLVVYFYMAFLFFFSLRFPLTYFNVSFHFRTIVIFTCCCFAPCPQNTAVCIYVHVISDQRGTGGISWPESAHQCFDIIKSIAYSRFITAFKISFQEEITLLMARMGI